VDMMDFSLEIISVPFEHGGRHEFDSSHDAFTSHNDIPIGGTAPIQHSLPESLANDKSDILYYM